MAATAEAGGKVEEGEAGGYASPFPAAEQFFGVCPVLFIEDSTSAAVTCIVCMSMTPFHVFSLTPCDCFCAPCLVLYCAVLNAVDDYICDGVDEAEAAMGKVGAAWYCCFFLLPTPKQLTKQPCVQSMAPPSAAAGSASAVTASALAKVCRLETCALVPMLTEALMCCVRPASHVTTLYSYYETFSAYSWICLRCTAFVMCSLCRTTLTKCVGG